MNSRNSALSQSKLHKIQQAVKWTVYVLLIANFVFYIFEDWNRAIHTLHAGSTLLDWTSEFATSIDEAAWFILLAMFELETYVLEDEQMEGWVSHAVRGVRLVCFVMLAHTIYAFAIDVSNYQQQVVVEDATSLCDLADADVSFVYNLEYTEVNEQTCGRLSSATQFYWLADDPVVSDLAGLNLERDLAWADLVEAVAWILIIFAIEVVVRLQSRGVTGGPLITSLNWSKTILYALLLGLGVYWATLSHWLYLWDEILWIGGFAAIEMNVSEWRDELLEEAEAA